MKVMRHRIILSFLLILICETSLIAQDQYNISQFIHETGDFFTRPGKWRGNDWLKFGAIIAGSVLVMQVDQPIRDVVLRDHERYFHSVPIETGRIWGEWYTPVVLVGTFGLHGWLADNASSRKIGFELAQAVSYSEAVTQTLKFVFGRARPYENKGAFSYRPFNIKGVGFQSLPGGHNTNGWAISTVLSRNAHSTTLKILAYVPSVLTFVSRVYQDRHWTSDDFSGAAIGFLVGTWVVNHHEKKESAVHVSAIVPITVSINFL
jgi:membrane-associated phospholipid phosphatase